MPILRKKHNEYVLSDYSLSKVNDMFLDCGNELEVNVSLVDKRHITDQQRKFIFALCRDISDYTGDDIEYIRLLQQMYYAKVKGIEVESLSNCSMTYANGLIDSIISFCIDRQIPFSVDLIKNNGYTFDEKQTYSMALSRYCVVCGKRADIHHVDTVGMGRNRNKISHIGMRALPLCREHHTICHEVGSEKFIELHHLKPFVIDKKMEYFIKKGKIKEFEDDISNRSG